MTDDDRTAATIKRTLERIEHQRTEMDVHQLLHELRRTVMDLGLISVPDDEAVDVIGDLNELYRRIGDILKGYRAELDPQATGTKWRAVETRTAKRSYNTDGILAAVMAATGDKAEDALQMLRGEDAVRLSWRWTQLNQALYDCDAALVKIGHEITDGDPEFMVGEVWSTRVALEPVEPPAGEVL